MAARKKTAKGKSARAASKGKKSVAKQAKKRAAAAVPNKSTHHAVFRSLAARSNQHSKSPVCYQQLGNGSWIVCFLQQDGFYGATNTRGQIRARSLVDGVPSPAG
jgi:hypothetical protein